MKKHTSQPLSKRALHALAAMSLATCSFAPLIAHAGETPTSDEWEFSGTIYLWATAFGGEVKRGGDIDITFDDVLQNLDGAFLGAIEARKDKWVLNTDIIYLKVSASDSGLLRPAAGDVALGGSIELDSWVITPSLGYNLINSKTGTLDAFVGARYLSLDSTVKLSSTGPLGGRYTKIDPSENYTDGIVGVRGKLNLEGNWSLPYYIDAGSGDSETTWQTYGGIDYHMDNTNLFFGYRYLEWDLGDAIDTLNVSGPIVGVKYTF